MNIAHSFDMAELLVELPTGTLAVRTPDVAAVPKICGFAGRRNLKRGFLFVSRVLGKHIPVRPAAMRQTFRTLAGKIPKSLPGPVLFVGMAETAVCLGTGVFDEWSRQTGRSDSFFLHTTRYKTGTPLAFTFQEEHSHATDHFVHSPLDPEMQKALRMARSIVLVDDEASTGKTFANFVKASKSFCTNIEAVAACVLTDWSDGKAQIGIEKALQVPVYMSSLLCGSYRFDQRHLVPHRASGGGQDLTHKQPTLRTDYGRCGCWSDPYRFNAAVLATGRKHQKTLVLGTGEFAWGPFRLAEDLEQAGVDVHYQSTTRSPILVGNDVKSAITFRDNYGECIDNYVYNVADAKYDRVIISAETGLPSMSADLLRFLKAEFFEIPGASHAY
ncbi:phosphoribosyltransferase domain-containing protein [Thalassospira xianhensis]|uniref:phosphoribosyltransferase domain-containing protein n=1 Tax=Thalassospira xianhensis TaxID=478503 RepID=UPI00142E3764|nr:phosphoribosyltransferase domain-containing protein [Thalassospira xianhensis]